uniref:Uncharacterized protein n=1 Tax=Rhabditophanes sp. KR3021 TaxID=114890 RepID=A0AC35TM37_9BILA
MVLNFAMANDNVSSTPKHKRVSSLYKRTVALLSSGSKGETSDGSKKSPDQTSTKSNDTVSESRLNHYQMMKHMPNRCVRGCSSYYGCCCSKGGKKLASIFGDSPPRHTYMSLPEFARLSSTNHMQFDNSQNNISEIVPIETKTNNSSGGVAKSFNKALKKIIKIAGKDSSKSKSSARTSKTIFTIEDNKPEACVLDSEPQVDKFGDKACSSTNYLLTEACTSGGSENIRRHSIASAKQCQLQKIIGAGDGRDFLRKHNSFRKTNFIIPDSSSSIALNRRVSLHPNLLLRKQSAAFLANSGARNNSLCALPIPSTMKRDSNSPRLNDIRPEGRHKIFKATASSLSLFSNGYLSDALSNATAAISIGGASTPDREHSRASSIITDLNHVAINGENSVTHRRKLFSQKFKNIFKIEEWTLHT